MDNNKTGSLIRETRKEKGLTQKALADHLHITDRAVSKWERGLSAPDIALLEPLGRILGLKVTELIAGEREQEQPKETEIIVKEVIDYSGREIKTKLRHIRISTIAGLTMTFIAVLAILWWNGVFSVIGTYPSPNGQWTVKAYDYNTTNRFSDEPAVTIQISGSGEYTLVYENSTFENIWWSPNSKRYVLSLKTPEGRRLCLENMDLSNETNLNAVLTFGVEASELSRYGYAKESGWPEIDYQFLQWSLDGNSLLIYYSFVDADSILHEGYFWYNCKTGSVDGIMEMRDTLYFAF